MRKNSRNQSRFARGKHFYPGFSPMALLEIIIGSRPKNRVGEMAGIKVGEHEEIHNTWASDPSSPSYDPQAAPIKVVVDDWQHVISKGSKTRTGRSFRKSKRRSLKRMEQRAAAKDIPSQLDDMRLDQEEREENRCVLKDCPNVLATKAFVDLTDSLFNEDNWLYVNSDDTQIEVAMCGSPSYPHMLAHLDEFDTIEAEVDYLDNYRHASHLPENHVVDADYMVTTEPETMGLTSIMDTTGMRVGGKLSRSGNVYGKVRNRQAFTAPELDTNDLPDMCENMMQAA